jgi:putative sigma-54 modulation protein
MKVVTHAVHFDADKKLLEFIERKLAKLEQFFDRIIGVDVYLKLESSSKVKDKVAEIKLNVPGATIIVKEISQSFEAAVDVALDSLKRQLIKYKEKERG